MNKAGDGRPGCLDARTLAVLAAAKRRFAANGYAGTGMEAVARDARVSTATLYAVFPSKADLFKAVVDQSLEEFTQTMRGLGRGDEDARQRLTRFAEAYARFLCNPFARSVFRLIVSERRRFQELAERFYARAREEFGGSLASILGDLAREGRFEAERPLRAAGQLLGMIEHPCLMQPLMTGDDTVARRTPEAIAADALETFRARYGREPTASRAYG
jgi:AcrR family transcriptional regulator